MRESCAIVSVRIPDGQMESVRRQAAQVGLSVSAYIRDMLVPVAPVRTYQNGSVWMSGPFLEPPMINGEPLKEIESVRAGLRWGVPILT